MTRTDVGLKKIDGQRLRSVVFFRVSPQILQNHPEAASAKYSSHAFVQFSGAGDECEHSVNRNYDFSLFGNRSL